MKIARSLETVSIALPLALFACNDESRKEAKAPSSDTKDWYGIDSNEGKSEARSSEPEGMTPASRIDESESAPSPAPQTESAAPEPPKAMVLTDEQIAAVTDATNGAEVDQARLALKMAKNPRVKKFAQMMIDQHGKAQRDQAALVSKLGMTPAESPKLKEQKTSAGDTDRTLKAAPKEMFDKVYIDIQVADHQTVLDALDHDFIPNAKNPELKKSLEDFRPKVQAHLDEALEIQRILMSTPSSKTGTSGSKGTPKNDTTMPSSSGTK